MRVTGCFIVALLGGLLVGCGRNPLSPTPDGRPQASPETPPDTPVGRADMGGGPPEPWISRPRSQWPQLLLTNKATVPRHPAWEGACAFLVQEKGGRVLAATARHLLGPLQAEEIRTVTLPWILFPRTQQNRAIHVDQIERAAFDILILGLRNGELPAYPLKLREGPVEPGEAVYLIGCNLSDKQVRQRVHVGKVLGRPLGPQFELSIDPPANLFGFSGSPVIDSRGHALGVLTSSGRTNAEGKNETGFAMELRAAYRTHEPTRAIEIDPAAAEQFQRIIRQRNRRPSQFLRLGFKPDDLTQYTLDLDPDTSKEDWRGESNGVPVVLAAKDLPRLQGAIIGYSPHHDGFFVLVSNPYRRQPDGANR